MSDQLELALLVGVLMAIWGLASEWWRKRKIWRKAFKYRFKK